MRSHHTFRKVVLPQILIFCEDTTLVSDVSAVVPPDLNVHYVTARPEFYSALNDPAVALVIMALPSNGAASCVDVDILRDGLVRRPLLLVARGDAVSLPCLGELLSCHPRALLTTPLVRATFQAALYSAIGGSPPSDPSMAVSLEESNHRLNARLQEINTIYTVGKSVVSSLDVNEILRRIVVASVNLTRAEDGFIVLKENGKLFVRVAKYKDQPSAAQLHLETSDSMAWQVIRSGHPAMLNREAKIATGMLVSSLLYVPLRAPGPGTFGILGVVNRERNAPFTENQLFTLSSVADFAAIALENARLFSVGEAERSRLSAILEHAAEVIIVTDMANRLWLWSETAGQVFGLDREAQGSSLIDVIDNADICELFSQGQEDAAVLHTEVSLDDGRVFNAQLSAIEGVGRMIVMQEITHLKELDRLKSEFVSTVSHDLRSPLTTIQGYVELLDRAGPLNEMQRDFVGRALTSLTHITALISDLLDIGRIEAGYDLEMKPLTLDTLLRSVVESAQVYADAEGIKLSLDMPAAALWVWGNGRRLHQVLDNLINNAIKYNQPQGRVRVTAHRDGDHAIVRVSDTGIGIPATEQTKIFERFYRVQSPETEEIRGTGLGLAIVKSVIEKHKGRIWVESTPGQGSTFAFVLPVYQSTPSLRS